MVEGCLSLSGSPSSTRGFGRPALVCDLESEPCCLLSVAHVEGSNGSSVKDEDGIPGLSVSSSG